MKKFVTILCLTAATAQGAVPALSDTWVVAAPSGSKLAPFRGGYVYSNANSQTIRAIAAAPTVSVQFKLDGKVIRVENTAPYVVSGNNGALYAPWRPALGQHTLAMTPYSGTNATGTKGTTASISFTVVGNAPAPTPTPTATPTPTPTPTPTATPSRSVTVSVTNPTAGDVYQIFYGESPGVYGTAVPIPSGQSSVTVPNLTVGKTYYFANKVLRAGLASVVSDPIQYTVTSATKQRLRFHK